MIDIADMIKDRVSIGEAVEKYCGIPMKAGQKYRCPCPIHNGKGNNFSINDKSGFFYCFVCGEKGDVITFVEKLYGMDFMQACTKLNDDFSLGVPLDREATDNEIFESVKAQKQRAAEMQKRVEERERELDRLSYLHGKLIECERIFKDKKPTDPYGNPDTEWVNAVNQYEYVKWRLGEEFR